MAYRKTISKSLATKDRFRDAVPYFRQSQIDTTNIVVTMLLQGMGITGLQSYLQKLRIPIAICVLLGAVIGGGRSGLEGFLWGALGGIAAPAVLLWLGVVVAYVAVYMGAFVAAWALILSVVYWLFGR
jgi:hypothetical protein